MSKPKNKDSNIRFKNSWKKKTLENLENDIWKAPQYNSNLVLTCYRLRKKQLKDFNIEDLRIMIGQNIGLKYLVPLAIEKLQENILSEGDFYKGDLLNAVLTVDSNYWKDNKENWRKIVDLFKGNIEVLESSNTSLKRREEWFAAFSKLETIMD